MISRDINILTDASLDKIKDEWFAKGVKRGKFEAGAPTGFDLEVAVNRFLGWKLPSNFFPDCYITFDKNNPNLNYSWPSGTNLLSYPQAKAMLEYVLGVTPAQEVRTLADDDEDLQSLMDRDRG